MQKRIVTILCLMAVNTYGFGATNAINIQKLSSELDIRQNIEIREDSEKHLTIDEIKNIASLPFGSITNEKIVLGFSRSAFWVRFALENKDSTTRRIFLEYGYPTIDSIDLYSPISGTSAFTKKSAGDMLPSSARDVRYRLPVFYLDVAPGSQVYYLRLETEGVMQFPLKLWEPEEFHSKRFAETGFLALIYGFIAVMALYNLFLAIMLRSSISWIYVLFISISISNFMGYQGLWVLFAPENLSSWLSNQGFIMSSGLFPAFACLFTYFFLDMKNRSRTMQGITAIGGIIGLLVVFISLFSYNFAAKISNANSALTCVALLSVSIHACFKRYRPAYFYCLAWIVTLTGNIASPLAVTGIIPVNIFTLWAAFVGVAVETVLISLALGDKMRLAQEKAAQEIQVLNESLENKVEEKTRDIKAIMSHINLGIFAVESAKHLIHRDYSRQVESIFGCAQLAQKPAIPMILDGAQLSEDEKGQIKSVFESSIGEDEFSFSANENCLPREISYENGQSTKILEFDWSPMISKSGKVERILVTCKDVSELRKIQFEASKVRKELEYIGELINIPQDSFGKFIQSTLDIYRENQRLLASASDFRPEIAKILFINLHTLKGAA